MIRRLLSWLAGEGFGSKELGLRILIQCFFLQKIVGLNRCVPWPVHWTSRVICPENIKRGTRFPGLSAGCHIDGRNGIVMGSNVWIGPRVTVVSQNHDVNNYHCYIKTSPIIIGNNCWLGANAVLLPGVELGDHTVVAAGAVVNRSFPVGNVVLAGVPASIVKRLSEYEG